MDKAGGGLGEMGVFTGGREQEERQRLHIWSRHDKAWSGENLFRDPCYESAGHRRSAERPDLCMISDIQSKDD